MHQDAGFQIITLIFQIIHLLNKRQYTGAQ